jgi:hypothetical protein
MSDSTALILTGICNPFYHVKVLSLRRIPLLIHNCYSSLFPHMINVNATLQQLKEVMCNSKHLQGLTKLLQLQRIYHVAFLKVLPSPEFSCKD